MDNHNTGSYQKGIQEVMQTLDPQMIICIVPNNSAQTYNTIKRMCCLEFRVPSQVVTARIIANDKKRMSVITKVAIQINCKLGGRIWGVRIPVKNIMVIGIDLHKNTGIRSRDKNAVAAFVASIDGTNEDYLNCTKYYSKCITQQSRKSGIDGLQSLMAGKRDLHFKT